VIRTEEEHLAHYGILRRSGRYPWGSGKSESTRNRSFLDTVENLRKDGMSEAEIARGFGITTTQLRAAKSIALAQQRQEKILTAQRLKDKGWGYSEIGRRMGLNESSVRALLKPGELDKTDAIQSTANMLKKQVEEKKYIQIGTGVENSLGVTRTKLDTSIAVLREQGYEVHTIQVLQVGTGKYTNMKVLAPPGTTLSEVQRNRGDIKLITDHSEDHGRNYIATQPPLTVNSKRVAIRYAEDGGAKEDGVIYVRRGAKDLSIGSANYAQVRIAIDGTHYMKGMAIYRDDLPEGTDLMFNTNKSRRTPMKSKDPKAEQVLKPVSDDPTNPFGAITRQIHDPSGKVVSAMNIVGSPTKEGSGEEGSWDKWSRNLPSQFLSKQNPKLAQQQLDLTFERRQREYDEISSLTNPTVRKKLLETFADSTDSAAVHLRAASLPRQATKVLLPVPSMKPHEVYAPSMRNGEMVALVRFPHGGTFEIPNLRVNNRNPEARKLLGTSAKDAIGIHHSVADRLSGADFDGDTVLVIPNNRGLVQHTPALEGLKGFDPMQYKIPEGSGIPKIKPATKQQEMGKVSNLITDMTIGGASNDEKARAIRHSMVVIDSEKHGLDYRQSAKDNNIRQLKEKYQGGPQAGARTLISQAGAKEYIPERTPRPARRGGPIDPVTGKKVYEPTGRKIPERKRTVDPITGKVTYVDTGRMKTKMEVHKRLAVTEDAFKLSSGSQMETIYAEHSNKLKGMANKARKEAVATKPTPYEPSAKRAYANEVASLDAQLNAAKKNAPLERQAQLIANQVVSQKRQANPNMEPSTVKKIKNQALIDARIRTGAHKTKIKLTQSEWDAIQAGAISNHKLEEILKNSDIDTVKALAMPKTAPKLSSTKIARAKSMLASGYTQAEVADALGVGLTTLKVGISE
jgi:DNA-binding CsgD family transcriptional regulator